MILGSHVSLGVLRHITLGHDVRVSRDVFIKMASFDSSTGRPPYSYTSKPVIIQKGVWSSARAIILGWGTLVENAAVAAVSRLVPARTSVAGVSVRTIQTSKSQE